jgi:hypothetical protein
LNAAQAGRKKVCDLPHHVHPEKGDQHRGQLSRVHRRNSNNMVARQRDDPVRSLIRRRVEQGRLRHRVTMNVYGSARRHLWGQLSRGSLAAVRRRPDFVSRSRPRLVQQTRMKHAPDAKGYRPLRLSHLRRDSRHSRGSKVARLSHPSTSKGTLNRKADRGDNQRKRHRQGHNNLAQ